MADAARYGTPPSRPKTTYGRGTELATALVIPSSIKKPSIQPEDFCVPAATHERLAVWFDGVLSEVSASDYFGPIRCRVADFFANVDSSLGDCLGGRSS